MKRESESRSVVSDSLLPRGLHSPWNSPGLKSGVGSLSLLQGSSQPRGPTQGSCIAGGFFTSWPQGRRVIKKKAYTIHPSASDPQHFCVSAVHVGNDCHLAVSVDEMSPHPHPYSWRNTPRFTFEVSPFLGFLKCTIKKKTSNIKLHVWKLPKENKQCSFSVTWNANFNDFPSLFFSC